jgi:predicted RNA-binding protein (TIGR00451 family)
MDRDIGDLELSDLSKSAHEIMADFRRFSEDVIAIAVEVFGNEAKNVLEALVKPVQTYYVRCNTHRISPRELQRKLENQGLTVSQHPMIAEALGIRVEGPFEIPLTKQRIIVDKQTAESVLQGADVYAPGILECGSVRVGDETTVVSEIGEPVATGKAAMSANDVLTFRKGLAVRVSHRRYTGPKIRELPEFSQGLLYPQSLAAMATGRVLDSQPSDTIVDMNCAPGGKLSHLSQLMHNSGRIYGFDRNSEKIKITRENSAKLGCTNVVLSIHDSRYLHEDMPNLTVDRVLIDPPCTALGLRPKVYDFKTRQRVEDLANYQKQFIEAASKIVKPGGVIVYSVCTFTAEECEMMVDFAEHECGLKVVEQKPFLGSNGLQAICESAKLCQRFHPHVHEIGYFIAKFER